MWRSWKSKKCTLSLVNFVFCFMINKKNKYCQLYNVDAFYIFIFSFERESLCVCARVHTHAHGCFKFNMELNFYGHVLCLEYESRKHVNVIKVWFGNLFHFPLLNLYKYLLQLLLEINCLSVEIMQITGQTFLPLSYPSERTNAV